MNTIRLLRDNVSPKLESSLQKEIRDEEQPLRLSNLERVRAQMRDVLTSRAVLIAVVVLCFTDCIMVIGELVLDMHAMKEANRSSSMYSGRSPNRTINKTKYVYSIEEKIAHGVHYASLTILGLLMGETILKISAFGRKFLSKKFEVFDAFIVTSSFIIDLYFLDGLTTKSVEESAYILSFLLPWRVIRVVNSMIVALLHREHIKLMLVFKSKQYLARQVDDISADLTLLQEQLGALKNLCRKGGIEDWRINQCIGAILTESSRRKNAIASLASISLGGLMNSGPMFIPAPKVIREETSQRSSLNRNTSTTDLPMIELNNSTAQVKDANNTACDRKTSSMTQNFYQSPVPNSKTDPDIEVDEIDVIQRTHSCVLLDNERDDPQPITNDLMVPSDSVTADNIDLVSDSDNRSKASKPRKFLKKIHVTDVPPYNYYRPHDYNSPQSKIRKYRWSLKRKGLYKKSLTDTELSDVPSTERNPSRTFEPLHTDKSNKVTNGNYGSTPQVLPANFHISNVEEGIHKRNTAVVLISSDAISVDL